MVRLGRSRNTVDRLRERIECQIIEARADDERRRARDRMHRLFYDRRDAIGADGRRVVARNEALQVTAVLRVEPQRHAHAIDDAVGDCDILTGFE